MSVTTPDTTQAEALLTKLEATEEWPPKWERGVWEQVRLWEALREADSAYLRSRIGWDVEEYRHRNYIVDPLPSKISNTFAALLYGEDPDFTAAADSDQDRLDEIVEENEIPSKYETAEEICSSEGEVWWRWLIDREITDVPVLEWHSRLNVLPLLRGGKVLAAAFVTTVAQEDSGQKRVWRYFEIHGEGVVLNVLFCGKLDKLGRRVSLTDQPDTADLDDEWLHGLPMLCGRVLNKRGRRPWVGVSDYAGVKDLLLALNETATIGQENARMTLKQRVVIPDSYLDVRGNFPAGADVILAPTTDQDPEKPGQQLAQLEWTFDANAFIAYRSSLERTIVGRVGLAHQLIDAGDPAQEGRATGTALRLRMLPALLAASDKGRFWDDQNPRILMVGQMLDALPASSGGMGHPWASASKPPVVERTPSLPEDETEEAQRHALLVQAEIESRQTAVRALHGDWTDDQVQEELDRLAAQQPAPLQVPPHPPVSVPSHGGPIGSEQPLPA
jgi:hypothetical protein